MNSNGNVKRFPRGILTIALVAVVVAWHCGAGAAPITSDLASVSSFSGQFVAYAPRSGAHPPALLSLATNADFVQLEPTLATVSCERIKQLLLRELDSTAPWRGVIYLVLYPARTPADTITINSQRSRNGWQYRVDLPDVLDRPRYVHAIVEVLLLELANRTAQGHAAEAPLWLTEGFTQLLLASSETEIILPPPHATVNGLSFTATRINQRKESLLQQAQKKLRGRPPLSFESLSWPAAEELAGEAGDRYCGSAQLFVGELLRLQDGRVGLRTMLAELPRHLNWQLAFLQAFHDRFQRPLDVEKWWALCSTEATERGLSQTWTLEESWQKLDQAIHPAVQVRAASNQLPLHTEITLQNMLREWDPVRQTQAINNSLRELGLLRMRVAQEYLGLVHEYSQVLENYLQQRGRNAPDAPFTRKSTRKEAVAAAVQQLDVLDARREAMRPGAKPVPAIQSPAPSPPVTKAPVSGNTISSTNVS
jgi:hypothetical protein